MKPSLRSLTHFTGRPTLREAQVDDGLLGVEELLDAKAAADVGRHDAQFVLRDVQHEVAHQHLDHMRELAGGPQRVVVAAGIVFGRPPRAAPSDCRPGDC